MKKIFAIVFVVALLVSGLSACTPAKPASEIIYRINDNFHRTDPNFYSVSFDQQQTDPNGTLNPISLPAVENRQAVSFQLFPDRINVAFMTFNVAVSDSIGTQTDMKIITFDRNMGYQTPASIVSLPEGQWLQMYQFPYSASVIFSDNVGDYKQAINIYQIKNPGELPTLIWTAANPFPTENKCSNWDMVEPSPDGKMVMWFASRFTGTCEDDIWPDESTGHYANYMAVISQDKGVIYTLMDTAVTTSNVRVGLSYNWYVWSPDSNKIFYTEDNYTTETRCFDIVDVTHRRSTQLLCRDMNAISSAYNAVWSPDSTMVAELDSLTTINVLDVRKPNAITVVHASLNVPEYIGDTGLVWSPDSEWIAFSMDPGGGRAGIYAVRHTGKDLSAVDINPEWSRFKINMPYPVAWWNK
jgi:hypothetical protein